MTIEAKIIADSIGPNDVRITSFVLTYPRFIHSEFMTHRMFSRNAASSRAIPVQKMIQNIIDNPAGPVFWGMNQKGMQASEEASDDTKRLANAVWIKASKKAIVSVKKLVKLGIHKQIANRLLEPFAHMTTLLTATDCGNFFNLRAHPDAQPEFQELAYQILELYQANQPVYKKAGEWHLPFADKYVNENLSTEQLVKIVTARAARVSYVNFDGDIDHDSDYNLHDRLAASGHWSPFEHAAKALMSKTVSYGNFKGWLQYRKMFDNENQRIFDYDKIKSRRKKR